MSTALYPKIKLWLVNENDEAVLGEGLARLLEAVEKCGSILEASSNLNMSYRYALHRISLAEKRLGFKIVKRSRGGASGGSSELTSEGKALLVKYEKIEKDITKFLKSGKYQFKAKEKDP
ncbi:MAG: LysR family transcriptional regulator [Candidatus Bathyarchaeia archaeon]|nr:LysR family transcriptional regulator [Candidatus Bathyarchaeota archaeon]